MTIYFLNDIIVLAIPIVFTINISNIYVTILKLFYFMCCYGYGS